MKIRHISGLKIGTVEHIENQTGRTLIALGVAEEIKLPARGSEGWLAARKELSDAIHAPGPGDVVGGNGIEWGVKQMLKGGKALVIKKVDGQVFYLDGPPADCPATIRQQFADMCSRNPEANAIALAAAKQTQTERDFADRSKANTVVRVAQSLGLVK